MSTVPPEVEYIVITFYDKIIIAASAAGFLFVVFMCMLCVLCPKTFCCCCCGGSDQPDDDVTKKRKLGSQKSTSSKSSYGSTESDYMYGSPDGGGDTGSALWTPLQMIKEKDGGTSDWSSDTGSGGHDVIQLDSNKKRIGHLPNGVGNGEVKQEPVLISGKIDFTLSYSWSEEKLNVKINEVKDLNLSNPHALVSPYVKIRTYRTVKQLFSFRDSGDTAMPNMEREMKTKMRRPADVLTYKEAFDIQMDSETLKNTTICFLLCDMDKLSRHITLGEMTLMLRKAKLLDVKEVTFCEELKEPSKEYMGIITLGTCYLPTSEKMYVTIESIKDLKPMDKHRQTTDACVKLHLMYDGKQLKRVKTTVRAANLNPVFNETFSFDIPQTELEKVYLAVVVCHYNTDKKRTRMIGRLYLGLNCDPDARDQWNSMMQNPRKKIVKSHKIID